MKSKHIVFVHGLFGWGPDELLGLPYWGKATQQFNSEKFNVHEASCGPVSSFHDRACEVYAQIKGTRVDYGEKHSQDEKHARFSDDFTQKPFVEKWSAENPVILIGHSAGAQTCMQLQQLLADKFWGGDTSADWIEAIVCVAGVINGSTLPYMLGCDKKSGFLTGPVGNFIGIGVQMLGGLNRGLTRNLFDWDLEQWVGSETTDLRAFIKALENSQFAKGKDNLAYDLTLQGCQEANKRFKTNKNSYYLSVVTEQTFGIGPFKRELPSLFMNPVLAGGAFYQAAVVDFDGIKPDIEGWETGDLTIDQWRENDGAVSSISQRYPFTASNHSPGKEGFLGGETIEKGTWYYERAEKSTGKSFDHLDVVFGYQSEPLGGMVEAHQKLYSEINTLLCKLP
ncbi:conserved hypothetical protein [Crenothrix polyspora]|uniref:triacylglycerol lipase n=1 Tax=Crenothrix polyspora TaxID=360316 RepID=A0A1R4HDF8_9GAMM|nr:hypothetical protein [Crenothrix polyspora]SJM94288.1 conserved hypothetical protein [Crenothrix polyspora]